MTYTSDHADRHAHADKELARDCAIARRMLTAPGARVEVPEWLELRPTQQS